MRKKYGFVTLFVVLGSFFLHAQNSVIPLNQKVYVIATEYTDVIYAKNAEQTAFYIAEHVDSIYEEAGNVLGVTSLDHIPVIVTQRTDQLNAYFSLLPYSRVVIYDTLPVEDLAVFDNTILSILYHELVHAISFKQNITGSGFVDGFSSIIGFAAIPPSLSEGLAVFAESKDGEGRLNNSYSMHVVRQAKMEGNFPSYADVAGAKKLYTDGSLPYIFGGAFTEYLYATYGAEKLIAYWNHLTEFNMVLYPLSFKKIYGFPLKDAWKDFENAIPMPVLDKEPTIIENKKHLYANLTSSNDGYAWQDMYSGDVFFQVYGDKKPRHLFASDLMGRLSLSQDGKYLSISGTTGLSAEKNFTRVYEFDRNFFKSNIDSLRDATVFSLHDIANDITSSSSFFAKNEIVVGLKTLGQNSILEFYTLDKEKSPSPFKTIEFNYGETVFSPLYIGSGLVASIVQSTGQWQIHIYDIVNDTQTRYGFTLAEDNPSSMANLSLSDDKLLMSFGSSRYTQPVLAYVLLDELMQAKPQLYVQKEQRSGGIFYPVSVMTEIDGGLKDDIVHISRFYEKRALSTFSISDMTTETLALQAVTVEKKELRTLDFEVKKHKHIPYYGKNGFIPIVASLNLSPIHSQMISPFSLGVGWLALGPLERVQMIMGAGYDFFKNQFSAAISTTFQEQNLTVHLENYASVGFDGFDLTAHKLSFDYRIPVVSDFNTFGFGNSFRYFYLQNTNQFYYKGHTIDNLISVYFQRMRVVGQSQFEKLGFFVLNQFHLEKYFGPDIARTNALLFGNMTKVEVAFPGLLIFENPYRFTVNLPFSVYFSKYLNYAVDWEVGGEMVLFSYEIQEPISFLHLFMHTITLDGGVSYRKYYDKSDDLNVFGNVYLTAGANTGFLVPFPIDLGLKIEWDPFVAGVEGLSFGLKFAINL